MIKGYFIRENDRTTCGGIVLDSDPRVVMRGKAHVREGDRVTCGVDGKAYRIEGGVSYIISHGRPVAGTLDSFSTCPCRAALIASSHAGFYYKASTPAAHRPASTPQARGETSPAPLVARTPVSSTNSRPPSKPQAVEIEEEEEEVELEQLITLRLGVFFDGTGNNQANSESVAGCMARDVGLEDQAEEIQRFCAEHGYGVDGSTPDNSYGNDTSNIARLYDLYTDQSDVAIGPEAEEASLKVYLEGIGTVSGSADALYAQATGRGKTGVLARVEQSPSLILRSLRLFIQNNPDVRIKQIEVDVFGFSRGAAAARHFANDIRNGASSMLANALPAGSPVLVEGFAWKVHRDVSLNFIGLFDTVPGIVSPLTGDFSPGNNRNAGLNLGLPLGSARKIVQLVARDEHRLNFALIRTEHDIVLPGSHSDIGGGYLPRMRERLLVSKPTSSLEMKTTPNERSVAYSWARSSIGPLVSSLVTQGIALDMHTWSVDEQRIRDNLIPDKKRVYVVTRIEREVYGDLSKVYLRVMRELGVRHGVPFRKIPQSQSTALPPDLESIATKLQAYALGESNNSRLTEAEESLLLRRYIHLSASWNAIKDRNNTDVRILFVNRPADEHQRVTHANE
ncbi:DUF2235 domain-containing protein [Pseudomonas putida]|uniref:PAAR domain-containing protein n=1 Tax=Pseudomonas putida TaxID=303 RepID=UPI0023647666|nr:PAAR domain-containing protein [Pseudomonas putida]MDD1966833.1 DUF2235 domain-containing protein [Pseudomonas putida]